MIEGTITALVTPFIEGSLEVDYPSLEKLVDWQLECKISGLLVGGTTGESATLDAKERLDILKRVIAQVNGRVPVLAGTGSNNTRASVEMTRACKEIGADAALVVNPYYNKPTQEGLYQHYAAVAKEGGLPVVMYNIPGRTAVEVSIPTFQRLAGLSEIVAVKQAVDSASRLVELAGAVGDQMNLLAGDDALTYFVMCAGGKGVISASANVIPKEMSAIVDLYREGNLSESLQAQIQALKPIDAMFVETNPGPAKAALEMMGIIKSDTMRPPMIPVKSETRDILRTALGLK